MPEAGLGLLQQSTAGTTLVFQVTSQAFSVFFFLIDFFGLTN